MESCPILKPQGEIQANDSVPITLRQEQSGPMIQGFLNTRPDRLRPDLRLEKG